MIEKLKEIHKKRTLQDQETLRADKSPTPPLPRKSIVFKDKLGVVDGTEKDIIENVKKAEDLSHEINNLPKLMSSQNSEVVKLIMGSPTYQNQVSFKSSLKSPKFGGTDGSK